MYSLADAVRSESWGFGKVAGQLTQPRELVTDHSFEDLEEGLSLCRGAGVLHLSLRDSCRGSVSF